VLTTMTTTTTTTTRQYPSKLNQQFVSPDHYADRYMDETSFFY
jgi:hypothetical protein